MPYRAYSPPTPALFGYDPVRDLPPDHLARLVEQVVEAAIQPPLRLPGPGQPPFDPRLPIKVLVYGYATGIRSSRQLERLCRESLPYLFLTRGDTPSYRSLCSVRVNQKAPIEAVWVALFAVAEAHGMQRLGHVVLDSTKLRANASPEAVLSRDEYEPLREELARILEEARAVDEREEKEGNPGDTRLGCQVSPEQMRDIVRRVRKQQRARQRAAAPPELAPTGQPEPSEPAVEEEGEAKPPPEGAAPTPEPGRAASPSPSAAKLTPQMLAQIQAALSALEAAQTEGSEHLCLTDPDAQMMYGGRPRSTAECHSFEVAVDTASRLLVAGQTTQVSHDNTRLEPLVEAAEEHEPGGVVAVDADSGYYQGDALGRLIEQGLDTCVPDSDTAGDLHRGQRVGTLREKKQGQVPLLYDEPADVYRCPEGNTLTPRQVRTQHGQQRKVYRATTSCQPCPRARECLRQRNADRRTLKVGRYADALEAARQRFNDPAQQTRYRHRGELVETVFGFLCGTLGYRRWLLRGKERVSCEETLFKVAYQVRRLHASWALAPG